MEINYISIFAAAVAAMVVGSLWYGPLFGKSWMKLTKVTEKDLKKASKAKMQKMYLMGFVIHSVLAWSLLYLGNLLEYKTINEWASLGFWVGFLFVGVGSKPDYIWTKRPKKLWLINATYGAISLAVMGIVLAVI